MVDEAASIYAVVNPGDRLFMGEILSHVIERQVTIAEEAFSLAEVEHPFAVIVSQDCDLEQDARARSDLDIDAKQRGNALVPHVLLLVASAAEHARGAAVSSKHWDRVKQNKDERFQFLCRASASVPALVIDFKRFFSFPTEELLRVIGRGEVQRGPRLTTPYAEHLAVRFGFFIQRVGLNVEHHDVEARAAKVGSAAPSDVK